MKIYWKQKLIVDLSVFVSLFVSSLLIFVLFNSIGEQIFASTTMNKLIDRWQCLFWVQADENMLVPETGSLFNLILLFLQICKCAFI
jgi:hypothetical protein